MDLNYYALAVSILANCIPETAFEKVQCDKPRTVKNQLTDDDLDDMVKLHSQGVTYKELGEIYCTNYTTVHKKLSSSGKLVKVM